MRVLASFGFAIISCYQRYKLSITKNRLFIVQFFRAEVLVKLKQLTPSSDFDVAGRFSYTRLLKIFCYQLFNQNSTETRSHL